MQDCFLQQPSQPCHFHVCPLDHPGALSCLHYPSHAAAYHQAHSHAIYFRCSWLRSALQPAWAVRTFLGLKATEPRAHGEKGPSFSGSDLSTQWLLSGKAVSPPSGTSAAAAASKHTLHCSSPEAEQMFTLAATLRLVGARVKAGGALRCTALAPSCAVKQCCSTEQQRTGGLFVSGLAAVIVVCCSVGLIIGVCCTTAEDTSNSDSLGTHQTVQLVI
jgi:hypothetical protein